MPVSISSEFDGGNIECLSTDVNNDAVRLRIIPDAGGEFFQWFYFRMTAPAGSTYQLQIENAGASSYPDGWKNYRVVASYDQLNWFRTDTTYVDGVLQFSVQTTSDVVWFAYFAPYSMVRHNQLISRCARSPKTSVEVLGRTHDNRDIDLLCIGDESKPLKIWSIARQHPGEPMAQWWMEGYLHKLLDDNDPVAKAVIVVI